MSRRYQLNRTKFLTPEELKAIYERLAGPQTPLRDRILVKLPINCGGRAQEILNAKPEDLDHAEKGIQIYGLKGSLDRFIPLPADVFDELAEYSRNTPPGEPIFDITYRWYLKIWKLYSPTKGIHAARHTFALEIYRRTKDLRLVKAALGHVNITNTMIYADYEYTRAEMRELIRESVA